MRSFRWAVVGLVVCCVSPALAAGQAFDVRFNACSEAVGIGYVPWSNARALVPSHYALATGEGGKAFMVVRVTNCNAVTVAGGSAHAARTAQVGIMLAGQDPSANINNYLLWFITDSAQLNDKLNAAGIATGVVTVLTLAFSPSSGALAVNVTSVGSASYAVLGNASLPVGSPVSFVANWFADTDAGTVRMHTEFPAIRFGVANTVLTPTPATQMAVLVDSLTLEFAVLDSYNSWGTATMQSRLQ